MKSRAVLFFLAALLLATLACGLGDELPQVTIPAGAAATAEAAAQRAEEMASTAVVVFEERGVEVASTAAAVAQEQSGVALSTVQASDYEIDIQIDQEALRDKVSNIQPDASGNATVVITDDEINDAIQVREAAAGEMAIENVVVAFTEGNAVLTGDVTQPVQVQLVTSFQPSVVSGQLQFDLVSASLGPLPVPPSLLSSVENQLNTALANALTSLPSEYSLSEVIMAEGSMTLVAVPSQ